MEVEHQQKMADWDATLSIFPCKIGKMISKALNPEV